MVLEWTPEEASLLQDRPSSAAASVYISRRLRTITYFPASCSLCMRLALHVHCQPFSVTSEESLDFMMSECMKPCACVIHTNLHTLSAACALVLSSHINVRAC